MTETGAAISFDRVGKSFTKKGVATLALEDVSLSVAPGAIMGIIGRSGAGKSTLLRMVNGLERPSTGRVLVGGRDVGAARGAALREIRRDVGMIFQHFNLLSAKTVQENVALPLRVAGVPRAEALARVREALDLVGLTGKETSYPSRLSGGQKQRVGIARALISRPEILLCDEATSALDPETTVSILSLLRDINRRLGLTVVLITHEMSVIREICDRVVVLDSGRIVETGPVWQVFGTPQADATRALLQPLQHALPEDLAARLRPGPAPHAGARTLLRLSFTGATPADTGALAAVPGARILGSRIERIQGHSLGQLLLALAPGQQASLLAGAADTLEVLGHVDAADD